MEVCVFSLLLTVLCVGLYPQVKSTSAETCAGPLITPPSLLIQYGSSAEVTCSIPLKLQLKYKLGWESKTFPKTTETSTSVVWRAENLTVWEEAEGLQCYITISNICQNTTKVDLTIYKNPSKVELSSESDLWVEGNQTELRCRIEDIGPGNKLSVRWMREDKIKNNTFIQFNETTFPELANETKSVSKTATLSITPRREDKGIQYQCEAVLNLKQEQKYSSHPIKPHVHCKEQMGIQTDKPNISQSIDKVLSVTMTYSADGKPSPGYTRTLPNTTIISNSSISISSFREEDWGQYTCIASNYLGQATWNVIITANRESDHTILMTRTTTIGVVTGAVVLVALLSIGFWVYYRHTHMNQYIVKQLRSHRNKNHVECNPDEQEHV